MATWSEKGTKIQKIGEQWNINGGQTYDASNGVKYSDINKMFESAIYSQETSDEAKSTSEEAKSKAEHAEYLAEEANKAVAVGQGTVVYENGIPVATFDADTKVDKVSKDLKLISDAFIQRPTATNDIEITDSSPAVKTATVDSIEGCTVKAIQQNGDMHNGTTNWEATGGTLSVGNGRLRLTLNEDMYDGVAVMYTKPLRKGRKYFIQCYVKPKYSTTVDLSIPASGLYDIRNSPAANAWNYLSGLWTPNTEDEEHIQITIDASTNYQVGDVIEVADFRIVDESDSATAWTKAKFDEVVPRLPYWEGVRHSNPAQLKSIGDNLVNVANQTISLTNQYYKDTYLMDIKVAGVYKLSYYTESISGAAASHCQVGYGDSGYDTDITGTVPFDQSAGRVKQTITFTVTQNMVGKQLYARLFRFSSPSTASYRITDVMLQLADNPLTEYKPYTEHILELPQKALKKVGNVADVIDMVSQTYTQRIGTYILDDTKSITYTQSDNSGLSNTVRFEHRFADILTSAQAFILNDLFPNIGNVDSDVEHIMNRYYNYYNIHIFIDKQRLVPYGYTDALSDTQKVNCFKAWLADNPLTIYFLLAEPTTEPLDKDYDATYSAWNYGMEKADDLAVFNIKYVLDVVKQVETNTESLAEQKKKLNDLINNLYPVGSIYMSINETSPAALFGGTWEQIAQGKTLVGVDTSDSDFNIAEKTGGEKEHALNITEIPRHNHSGLTVLSQTSIFINGSGAFVQGSYGTDRMAVNYTQESTAIEDKAYTTGGLEKTYKQEVRAEFGVPYAGSGQSHNNLQPYFTCYIWKRVA